MIIESAMPVDSSDNSLSDIAPDERDGMLLEAVEHMEGDETPPLIQETSNVEEAVAEDKYTGAYEWKIKNFPMLSADRMYSPTFDIGTYLWRILVYPKGNKPSFPSNISVFLDAPEAPYTPMHMSPYAFFRLTIINHLDPTKEVHKDISHTFTEQNNDWGFAAFMNLDTVLNPRNGFLDDDNGITIRVDIRVQKDERYSYDSRKETGCVGLKNQGATCYMNSLLQYLYHIPYFRKAVYHMPTLESDEAAKHLPLALQSLFYKLQYSNTSVSTKDLTKSFGWGTYDAFQQHDVQELNRVLCEKLEEKMKGTRVEKVITDLFEGYTYSFIDCVNVDYKSTRKESFMDLQLDVKGCRDIYDSLTKYCEVETMDGPNQYKAEGHGLQDARKGVLFESLPPVLQLQLKRFEYDFQKDAMVKLNTRYEFSDTIDLDFNNGACLSPKSDRSVRNLYRLHSVLVHSGGVQRGHYYAYIRPDGTKWLKFDDERVTLETDKSAMDDQFGGEDDNLAAGNNQTLKYTRSSNAYMLVYVRISDWDRICCHVTKEEISEHLCHRLEQEQLEKEMRQKEKLEAHLFCTLKVATDTDIHEYVGKRDQFFGLVAHDKLPAERIYRIKKNLLFTDFKQMVAEKMGIPVESQRYWTWARRSTGSYRLKRPLTHEEELLPMVDLKEHRETRAPANKHAIMDVKLFLETPQILNKELMRYEEQVLGELGPKPELFLFVKHYDPTTEQLRYVTRLPFCDGDILSDELLSFLGTICGLPVGAKVDVYVEISGAPVIHVELLQRKDWSLEDLGLSDGDIIIVQEAADEFDLSFSHPTVAKFLEYVSNRRLVKFRKLEDPTDAGFTLEVLKDMTYDEVTDTLAHHLKLAVPTKLRLTQHSAISHQPHQNPMKYRGVANLELMLLHANHINEILYYEILDMPLPELEQLKTLIVAYHNERAQLVSEHTLRLPKRATVEDVLEEVQRSMESSTDGVAAAAAAKNRAEGRAMRLLTVYNNKLYKVREPSDRIENINECYWTLRSEWVPEDQMPAHMSDNEQLIYVNHFKMDNESSDVTNFGDPFLMRISNEEALGDIKQRIKATLGTPEEEFAKWEFAFVSEQSGPEFLQDEDVLGAMFAKAPAVSISEANYLGLQHEDKTPRRPASNKRSNYEQRAVKIFS